MPELPREQIIFGDIKIDLPKTSDAVKLARGLLDLFEEWIGEEWIGDEMTCMFCGCTESIACQGGCSWIAPNVCSACADKYEKKRTGQPKKNQSQIWSERAHEEFLRGFLRDVDFSKLGVKGGVPVPQAKEELHEEVPQNVLKCPRCGNTKLRRYGNRKTSKGRVQQYQCKDCEKVFVPEQKPGAPEQKVPETQQGSTKVEQSDTEPGTAATIQIPDYKARKAEVAELLAAGLTRNDILLKLMLKKDVLDRILADIEDDRNFKPMLHTDTHGSHGEDFEKIEGALE